MIDQQKKEFKGGYNKVMESFYYDYREKGRASYRDKENMSVRKESEESRRSRREGK